MWNNNNKTVQFANLQYEGNDMNSKIILYYMFIKNVHNNKNNNNKNGGK